MSMARSKLWPISTSDNAIAERFHQFGKGLGGRLLGMLPGGRADEGEARRQWRFAGRRVDEGRTGEGARIRILLVEAREYLREQRRIVDRAREHADMIERPRQQQRAAARNETVGRLEADHAAEGGGADHRAVGLRADGARHHQRRHRRGGARGRSARRVIPVVRIAGLARIEVGVFGRHRLAEDHGARRPQPRHRRRIAARRASGPQLRAEFGRHIRGVEDVLDAHGHAMQRPGGLALLAAIVGGLGLPHRVVAVEERPRLDIAIGLVDALEAVADQLRRTEPAVADSGRGLREAERIETHAHPFSGCHRGSRAATTRSRGRYRPAPW